MPAIIEVDGLAKRYGDVAAVDGISFTVEEGEIFGLLGPNGAGKTTTISMLSCLIEPTEGDATVAGNSIRTTRPAVKRALGVVPQDIALYPTLTALENLRFWAEMYGLKGDELKTARRRGARGGRARGPREGADRDVLGRHEAAHQHRRRDDAPTQGARDGRAHRRHRPSVSQPHPADGAGAQRRRA